MTALKEYERLESLGLWRETGSAQLIEVVVSFGDLTLVLSDKNDRAITHWSLAAVRTLNPGETPTIYAPARQADETLEIDDVLMIEAIAKIRRSIRKAQSHPGRLRWLLGGVTVLLLTLLAVFWLPLATVDYATKVVPMAAQQRIGADLMGQIALLTGQPCSASIGRKPLEKMRKWLLPAGYSLHIVNMGAKLSTALPGGRILLNRSLLEKYSGPEVVAGFVLMERALGDEKSPMSDLFEAIGTGATLAFLANGSLSKTALADFAQMRLTAPPKRPAPASLLALFAKAGLTSSPFALALDSTLTSSKPYVEDDPVKASYVPTLTDGDWIALQSICGEP